MAPVPKRATGANVKLRARFEAASGYGTRPSGNFVTLLAYSFGLSKGQPLEDDPLLGAGREPGRPQRGAIDVTGSVEVPIDRRLIGYWLKELLGAPVSSTVVGARGFLEFNANPLDTDTITLDGVTWTFVASGPTGNETLIGADLAATLAQLVIDLNASVDVDISAATYSTYGDRLAIDHDTADNTGDSFTLAASGTNVKLSAATLTGGGLTVHQFNSASTAQVSMTIETEHAELAPAANPFTIHQGVLVNSMTIGRARAGQAKATLELIGQSEFNLAATVGGTPLDLTVDLFSQFQGFILVDGIRAANVTGAKMTIGNNLDVVEALRDDGLIEGADAGIQSLGLTLTARYSDTALKKAAEAENTVDLRFGFRHPASGSELLFELHQVDLPLPRKEIPGPGGIEVTYETIGSKDDAVTRSLTVSLWNDRPDYANPA